MVPIGLKEFASVAVKHIQPAAIVKDAKPKTSQTHQIVEDEEIMIIREEDLESAYLKSLGVELLQQTEDGKAFAAHEKKFSSSYQEHLANPKPLDAKTYRSHEEVKIANQNIQDHYQTEVQDVKAEITHEELAVKSKSPSIAREASLEKPKPSKKKSPPVQIVKPLSSKKPTSVSEE